jgi:hypothetical protein
MATEKEGQEPKRRRPPAKTPEGREQQLISLAVDLAEQQLATGTASAQVITHYLKLATEREKAEVARIKNDNRLTDAKIDQMASVQRQEELYAEALKAMRQYAGQEPPPPEEEVDYPGRR